MNGTVVLQDLDSVLRLRTPAEEGKKKDKDRMYTLNQLTDLHSRLMLVAGKAAGGKEDVDRFVQVSNCRVDLQCSAGIF